MNFGRSDDIKRCIREKAGVDEATMVGLRERVHSGLLPLEKRFMENAGWVTEGLLLSLVSVIILHS